MRFFNLRAALVAAALGTMMLLATAAGAAAGGVVTINHPADGAIYNSAGWSSAGLGWSTLGFTPANPTDVHCQALPTPDGQYKLTLTSYDGATPVPGHSTFTIDTTPPALAVDPLAGDITNDATPELTFGANEPLDTSTVACAMTTDVTPAPPPGDFTPCGSPFSPGPLSEGKHVLWVHAKDLAGNQSAGAAYVFHVDTVAPAIQIGAPTPGQVIDAPNPDLDIRVPDGTAVCAYDGESYAPCDAAFAARTLPGGVHVLHVRATDTAGNVSEASVSFTIDASPGPPRRPQVARFRVGDARVLFGGRVKRKLTVIVVPPDGADVAQACAGTVTLSVAGRAGGGLKSLSKQAALRASGANCLVSATFVLPKAFRKQRLRTKISFAGNTVFAPFAITGKIKN